MTDDQAKAIEEAAQCGGKFLDGIGETDLAKLSYDHWMTFIATVCQSYDAARLSGPTWKSGPITDDEIPF